MDSPAANHSEAGRIMWSSKVGIRNASVQKLFFLPPTTEAFIKHYPRAHLQLAILKSALKPAPQVPNPASHCWSLKAGYTCTTLSPTSFLPETLLAPLDPPKHIQCCCQSQVPCKTQRCSCQLSIYSILCIYQGRHECQNERNKAIWNINHKH